MTVDILCNDLKNKGYDGEDLYMMVNKNTDPYNRNRTHSLFFAPEAEKREFHTALKEVQEYIAENYSVLITNEELDYAEE